MTDSLSLERTIQGVSLQKIATAYSRLSPLFAHLRSLPSFKGNTLLPNALSPIAPAMAYGHCGDLEHGKALARLKEYEGWRKGADQVKEAYQSYKKISGNALLWAGWNYWDPSQNGEFDGRVIQLVLTKDLLTLQDDLLVKSRELVAGDTEPFLTVGDFLEEPENDATGQVRLGARLSSDVSFIPKDLIPARLFLHNIWEDLFVPSVKLFREHNDDTIVDHVLREHEQYGKNDDYHMQSDFGGLFGPNHPTDELSGVRGFFCFSEWTDILWAEVARAVKKRLRGTTPKTSQERVSVLLDTWQALASSDDFLQGPIRPALDALSRTLRPHVQNERKAYVILQHLALFDKFLHSHNQYVFPISFGQHLFVVFMAMKKPLTSDDAKGWRQVGSSLFGSLLVELLTDLYTKERLLGEQRLMLSHSLPKSVFKPTEYFAVKVHSGIERLRTTHIGTDRETKAREAEIEELQGSAEMILFLLQKGQAEIGSYAESQGNHLGDRAHLDLGLLCDDLVKHAELLKTFFLSGLIDRVIKNKSGRGLLREGALAATEISYRPPTGGVQPVVRANRGLLFLHLWNAIDNAFRFANFRQTGLLVTLEVEATLDRVSLMVRNTGTPINQGAAACLNEIFATELFTSDVERLRIRLRDENRGAHLARPQDIQGENRGIGLIRFSQYLAQLWEEAGESDVIRGKASPTDTGTDFEFYFPRV